jgi:hypothetical protein
MEACKKCADNDLQRFAKCDGVQNFTSHEDWELAED